jgi:predicted PurR-regulated permease PerM
MDESKKTQTAKSELPSESRQVGMESAVNNVVSYLTNVPKQSIVSRFLVMLASVVVIGYGVSAASKIIGPIFLALFLAIILHVPLQWMQKKGCPKFLALIIVIVFTIIVFVGISYHVAKSLNYLVAKSPEYKANLEAKIAVIDKRLEQIGIAISGLTAWRQSMENKKIDENNNENNNDEIDETTPQSPAEKDKNNNDSNNRFNNSDNNNSSENIRRQNNNSSSEKTLTEDVNSAKNIDQKTPAKNNGDLEINLTNNRNVNSTGENVGQTSQGSSKESAVKEKVKELTREGEVESGLTSVTENGVDIESAGQKTNSGEDNIRNDNSDDGGGNIETTSLSEFLGGGKAGFGILRDNIDNLQDEVKNKPKRNAGSREKSQQLILLNSHDVMSWLRISLVAIRQIGESAFLVLIFTIFMVFEAASFPTKVDKAFGFDGPINNQHLQRIAGEIRRYLFLKATSSMMSAVAATVVYWFFGVPAMFFWGLVAFFLYFIPNVGGILASIIPGLLIFMTHDWQGVAIYGVCLIAIECTIGYGIEPKMLGHGLGISTVVILLSLFTWGMLLGPIGLFMAAPLTIMVKITLQAFKETEWIATLIDR